MIALPHRFVVGSRYRNNVGSYEVLFIDFPLMDVRYEHGQLAKLSIPIQWRIQERLQAQASSLVSSEARQQQAAVTVSSVPHPAVSFWWVNQGSSYYQECRQSILAAPIHGIDGRSLHHHEAMRHLHSGDQVLHYVRKELLAFSKVTARTDIGVERPDLHAGSHDRVYIGHVAYTPLGRAIHIDEIPAAWRMAEGGPFVKNGNPKFGYLYPLSRQFMQQVTGRFSDRLGSL